MKLLELDQPGANNRVSEFKYWPHQFIRLVLLLGLVCTLVACSGLLRPNLDTELPELRPGNYQLDPRHSRLLFKVDHLGLSQFIGRFNQVDARLQFDPEQLEQTRLDARVETGSIDVNDPDFELTLSGSDWLDVEQFPAAVFQSETVQASGDNQLTMEGQLTLLGVRRPITLEVTFNGGGYNWLTSSYTLGFKASGRFLRSDFGLDSFIPAIGDEIELEIHGEFLQVEADQ